MDAAVVQLRLDDGAAHVELSAAARGAVHAEPVEVLVDARLAGEPRVLERPPGAIGEAGAVKERAAVAVDGRARCADAKGTLRGAEDGRGHARGAAKLDPPGGAAGVPPPGPPPPLWGCRRAAARR